MLKRIRKSITAKFSNAPQPQVKTTSQGEAPSLLFFGEAKPVSPPVDSKATLTPLSTPVVNATTSASQNTDTKAMLSSSVSQDKPAPLDHKAEVSAAAVALNCVKLKYSADDYLKDAKFKPTPGLLFKSVTPFKPLTARELIDEEVEDIQALAQRLWALRRTLDHDVACLQTSQSLTASSAVGDSKAAARRASLIKPVGGVGKAWSKLDANEKAVLTPGLEHLSYDERLMVLDILSELDALVTLRARARGGWLQLKTAVRLGGFAKKAKALAQVSSDATAVSAEVLASTVAPVDAKAQTAVARSTLLDIQRVYQHALLAYDRRSGWAKLEADKRFQPKEQKEQKTQTESKTTQDDKASKVALPPAVEQLRKELGNWLGAETGKVPLVMVQARLAAIQDFCHLSNRISEGVVHFAHDIQLAKQVLAQFKAEAFKDDPAVVQTVCQLAAAQDADIIRGLLGTLIDSVKAASLLEVHVLEGLATVLHYAHADQVGLGDLHTLLKLLIERSSNVGNDLSESDTLRLVQAIAAVLSSMALVSQHRQVQFTAWQAQKAAKSTQLAETKTTSSSSVVAPETKPATNTNKTKDDSLLFRLKRSLQTAKDAMMDKIEEPQDYSGLAMLNMADYDALCLKLNETLVSALKSRFDFDQLTLQNPDMAFALSVIRQALMRIAHQELSRSEKIIAGARQFFTLLESAKTAVTDFSPSALFNAGSQLITFIGMTPLGDKLKAYWDGEEASPQAWFEHYLILKTLVASDQLPLLELQLVEGVVPLSYSLSQGVLQLFDRLVHHDNRDYVREAALQFLNLLANDQLWQWPQQSTFNVLQQRLKQRCDKEYPAESRLTLVQRLGQQAYSKQQAESQRRLRQARRHCQESDLRYQWHDYCVQQTRLAHQDKAWLQDDSRYVPALAKSRFDVVDEQAELFYPTVDKFLRSRQAAVTVTQTLAAPKMAVREESTTSPVETKLETKAETKPEVKAETKAEIKSETKAEISPVLISTSTKKTQHAMLILGDAGTGKSLFLRRNHLMACARYFGRVFDQAASHALGSIMHPLSVHVYLSQSPIEGPLEHYFSQQGFTEAQIRQLKEQAQLLIHCDGYDEWSSNGQSPWIFAPKTLGGWLSPRLQVMVSCRSQHLQSDPSYLEYFTPPSLESRSGSYAARRDASALVQWIITRLDVGGVERLTQYYVHDEQAQGKTPWDVARYLQQFHASGIQELVRTPIILLMALQVLPVLEKRYGKNATILRLDIYREFIGHYIDTQRNKKLERGGQALGGLTEAAHRYAEQLALALFTRDKVSVTYQAPSQFSFATAKGSEWDRFFAPASPDRLLSEIIPLRISAQRDAREGATFAQYSFIHKSMLDYFTALGLYQAIEQLSDILAKQPPAPPQLVLPSTVMNSLPLLAAASSQTTLDSQVFLALATQWEAGQRYAQAKHEWEVRQQQRLTNSPLACRSLKGDHSVIQFVEEILQDQMRQWRAEQTQPAEQQSKTKREYKEAKGSGLNTKASLLKPSPRKQFKTHLTRIIEATRIYPELASAGGNAATLLAACHYVFAGYNWQGIRLTGADLVGSYWHRVDLQRAELRGCDLAGSAWWDCDLREVHFKDVRWGEFPSLKRQDKINAIVFNPRAYNQMAIASGNDILLYDTKQSIVTETLRGHGKEITCLQYSPDGLQLASGSDDGTTCLWDPHGEVEQTPRVLRGHEGGILCLQYSPDGLQLASGSDDGTVCLWDPRGKVDQTPQVLREHVSRVCCLQYSPDGGQLASLGSDYYAETVCLWDPRGGADQTPRVLRRHGGITCLRYSRDGGQLASGSLDGTVCLWDPHGDAEQTPRVLRGHEGWVCCLQYSLDGGQLASSSDDTVCLWDPHGGEKQMPRVLRGHAEKITCLQYSLNGSQLASSSDDHTVRLWDPRGGEDQMPRVLRGHEAGVLWLQYSPDSRQLASGSLDQVCLWDSQSGAEIPRVLPGHEKEITCLECSVDGSQLASGSEDYTVRLWDLRYEENQTPQVLRGHEYIVRCLQYSPDGAQLASGSEDYTVRLWNPKEGANQTPQVLRGSKPISCLQYSSDGSQLASSGGKTDKTIRLWDPRGGEGQIPRVLRGHEREISFLRYSPDMRELASGSKDGTVCLWDSRSEGDQIPRVLREPNILCLQYSPDGGQLALGSGGYDSNHIRLWNPKESAEQVPRVLRGHEGWVYCLQYSPDGLQLASGSSDVRLWDPRGGEDQTSLVLRGHKGRVCCLRYSPDGLQLASGSSDNTVRLWDSRSGKCLQVLTSTAAITVLCWRWESKPEEGRFMLFVGDKLGSLSCYRQGEHGLQLTWIRNNVLPALSFQNCQLNGIQASNLERQLLSQRGGVLIEDLTSQSQAVSLQKTTSSATVLETKALLKNELKGLPAPHSQLFSQPAVVVSKPPELAVSHQTEHVVAESSSVSTHSSSQLTQPQ